MHSGMRFGILTAAAIGSYPLHVIFFVWQGKTRFTPELLTLLTAGVFLLSLLHGLFVYPLEKRSLLAARLTAIGAGAVIGAAVWFLTMGLFSPFGSILLAVFFAAIYLIGWQLRRYPPEQMLHMGVFLGLTTAFFLGMLCLFVMKLQFELWRLWLVYGIMSLLFGILRSRMAFFRAGYQENGSNRHHGMLIGLFVLPCALVLLAGAGLSQLLGKGLSVLWRLFVTWFRQFFVEEKPEDLLPETTEAPAEIPQELVEQGPPWLSVLLAIACIGLGIWLLVRYRAQIVDFLTSLFRKAALHLQRFLTAKTVEEQVERTAEYADYVESIENAEMAVPRGNRRAVHWRRQYRRYKKMPAGTERFRLGYGLWLEVLQLKGMALSPSDTPAQVLEKADSAEAAAVTENYYAVRYGGTPPTPEAQQALDRLLKRR